MKTNRRGFLKAVLPAILGLFGLRLPGLGTEPQQPIDDAIIQEWPYGACPLKPESDLRAFITDEGVMPVLGAIPSTWLGDAAVDIQAYMREALYKASQSRKRFTAAPIANESESPKRLAGHGVTITVTYGPESQNHEGSVFADTEWVELTGTECAVVKLRRQINPHHPLARGLVGFGFPNPDADGGIDWWQKVREE